MSLKSFHLFFILAAAALAALFGWWNLSLSGQPGAHAAVGAVSFGVTAALLVYLPFFLRRMRGVSYL